MPDGLERLMPRLQVWGPAWAMMALIFGVSSLSRLPTPAAAVEDGIWHALAYGVLGGLLLRGVAGARWLGVTIRAALVATLLASLYGATDELHQWFVPGRAAELSDLGADAIGATMATCLIWGWRQTIRLTEKQSARDVRT